LEVLRNVSRQRPRLHLYLHLNLHRNLLQLQFLRQLQRQRLFLNLSQNPRPCHNLFPNQFRNLGLNQRRFLRLFHLRRNRNLSRYQVLSFRRPLVLHLLARLVLPLVAHLHHANAWTVKLSALLADPSIFLMEN